jgi:chromosome segregation ATPase
MVEAMLQQILQEIKLTQEKISTLEGKISSIEVKINAIEVKINALEEKSNETKAICEAIRHGQEVLVAKYDSLALDVHNVVGTTTSLKNSLDEKVLPAIDDHESSIQVLNTRVFKVESTLQRLVNS